MPKRKLEVDLNDTSEGITNGITTNDIRDNARKIQHAVQNSLDSDEEDDEVDNENGEIYALNEDDIEGQEDGAVGFEGDVQLTPFNMKEEMEEGHFDVDGMYHWKKDGQLARDNWLDNIDWVKVNKAKADEDDEDSSDFPSPPPSFSSIEVYQKILPLMKPKETVAKSLQRLAGNKIISTAERLNRKKTGLSLTDDEKEAQQNLIRLTELADSILQNTGNMDIYQETYEYILNKVIEASRKSSKMKESQVLDMYADDFDEKEKKRLETKEADVSGEKEDSKSEGECKSVMWEFKWTKDSTEIIGPHSSEQMYQWANSGYFKGEVWVRKFDGESEFHSSRRIDFDLYL